MTHPAFLVRRHLLRSGSVEAKGDAHPPPSPGAAGARRWSVKVANLIASQYGFEISAKTQRHD
jgi:hypothetical protein